MTPEEEAASRQWFRDHGIELDDDGLPILEASDSPPAPCMRCGAIVEGPREAMMYVKGVCYHGCLCVDCFRLMLTNAKDFWNGPERQITKLTAPIVIRIIVIIVCVITALYLLAPK